MDNNWVQLIGSVLAVVWTLIRASEWWKSRVAERESRAVACIEAAVAEVWDLYVGPIKRTGRDLTVNEKIQAKAQAITKAVERMEDVGAGASVLAKDVNAIGGVIERTVSALKAVGAAGKAS